MDVSIESENVSGEWELRAAAGRAVLSGGSAEELPEELVSSLTEWARVADVLAARDGTAGRLVADRGRRLALQVADRTRIAVRYIDPVHGGEEIITPTREPEPVPWATGLPISLTAATIVVVALFALSEGLESVSLVVAVIGNIVIAVGLAPSLWLLRNMRTWRWVAYGVAVGIVGAWIGMVVALPA